MNGTAAQEAIVRGVMDRWKTAVDAHQPQQVASIFTEDAVFQGLHPYSVGRQGVADYYDSQPIGLAADYRVLETRRLAQDVLLGYLGVDFSFTDRPAVQVTLSVVLRRLGDQWYIAHYQVSKLG
ncbi:SgcJ/EcaC family oxidoreductase [Streptacidiphilus sp. ASG 303]|uniref:SgcJ/EcaC family oxidoreductase n=1 Tax=Streptacidiphilus sp. ASG 303 TaxID=2896847 RepID=UPI001E5D24E6|nr:SgcJ/EcaC family oxidoreductase [Streptacidiphilus sp. ASG 303]MCD0484164.1 SgcJ/EcaC family oxidoreductase [Streptacidiphilus sp. ASG 303]